jgi:hypothetical protein
MRSPVCSHIVPHFILASTPPPPQPPPQKKHFGCNPLVHPPTPPTNYPIPLTLRPLPIFSSVIREVLWECIFSSTMCMRGAFQKRKCPLRWAFHVDPCVQTLFQYKGPSQDGVEHGPISSSPPPSTQKIFTLASSWLSICGIIEMRFVVLWTHSIKRFNVMCAF